jgi:acyl-CoA thioesterase FadM
LSLPIGEHLVAAGFVVRIPIRFSDIEAFGHVNHSTYLAYNEDHRTVMLAKMCADTGSWLLKTGFAIAWPECSFVRPILLDDRSVVWCTETRWEPARSGSKRGATAQPGCARLSS